MPKISIIIPCYNVENYIDRCLNSIINQSIGIDMLEIILVNDASTDSTYKKMQLWEQKYPENIMLISYDTNCRQGYARNLGLSYASGEFISFIDADDWISNDFYEVLYQYASTQKYDVTYCKFIREHYPDELIDSYKNESNIFNVFEFHSPKVNEHFHFDTPTSTGTIGEYGSCCTGLYKKSLLIDNDIRFPENMAYEDNYFGALLRLYASSYCIIDKVMYHYFINANSTTTKYNSISHIDRLDVEVMKIDLFKSANVFSLRHEIIEYDFIKMYYLNSWYLFFTRYTFIPEIFNDMRLLINDLFPNWNKNPRLSDCTPREKILLEMLQMNHNFSIEELTRIKLLYLESMV